MRATLDNLAAFEKEDLIRFSDGVQTVCDDNECLVAGEGSQAGLYRALVDRVEGRGNLIKKDKWCILQESTCDRDSLAFAT